ncbi:MAG: polyketide cyclase [Alphaproteobacteria bacterium]|nr:polyketide cyclase [Alphaproteobacteria bacterium]
MTRTAVHSTFEIERRYKAAPARVFAAWSTAKAKSAWFHGPDERGRKPLELDFRVGGREVASGTAKDGTTHRYEATYLDIAPNERFILAYVMHIDQRLISASLMTVEVFADGNGTRLKLTEQDAYLDGWDEGGGRERGTADLLDQLGAALGE